MIHREKCVTSNMTRMITTRPISTQYFEPKARADAEAVKNDLNYNNELEVGASTFKDNL